MINFTGCASPFAHDNVFSYDDASTEGPCTLLVPLYVTFFSLATLLNAIVSFNRTRYLLERGKQYVRKSGSRLGVHQILTLVQSWTDTLAVFGILLVPMLVEKPPRNVMAILLGVECICFNCNLAIWRRKVLRLGTRIIHVEEKVEARVDEGGALVRLDRVLTVLVASSYIAALLQALFMTILAPVLEDQKMWLLLGFGFQGYYCAANIAIMLYQYERCKRAIIETSKRVRAHITIGAGDDSGKKRDAETRSVIRKFTQHQAIYAFGLIGAVLYLLFAGQVLPTNNYALICFTFFDIVPNASAFFVFVTKTRRNPGTAVSSTPKREELTSAASSSPKREELASMLVVAENQQQTIVNSVT